MRSEYCEGLKRDKLVKSGCKNFVRHYLSSFTANYLVLLTCSVLSVTLCLRLQ